MKTLLAIIAIMLGFIGVSGLIMGWFIPSLGDFDQLFRDDIIIGLLFGLYVKPKKP